MTDLVVHLSTMHRILVIRDYMEGFQFLVDSGGVYQNLHSKIKKNVVID